MSEISRPAIRELIPRGTTGILDLLGRAADAGWRENDVLEELQKLRRDDVISFNGRTVQRPPRKTFGERHTPKPRRDHDPDAGWFRIGLPGCQE